LLFSGRLLPKLMPVQQEASIAQLPFLVQHGTQDQVVPVDGGRGIRAHLEALGATVEYHEYPMGHEINAQSFADAKNWMLRQLD
ncbi:MAG TPA: hypothetical protein VKT78_02050, partial [Fimbriimonadaceae bacterium]|nr:hypothetical protein [Fimbriimonadaceae bacterium]